jgi:hypothetical protein
MRTILLAGGAVALLSTLVACSGKVIEEPRPPIAEPDPSPLPRPAPTPTPDPYVIGVPSHRTTGDPGLQTQQPTVQCKAKLGIACEMSYPLHEHTFENATTDAQGRMVLYLGIYESKSGYGQHVTGDAAVSDTLASPHTLVLSSYEATRWTITMAPGSGLSRVIASGYHAQTVSIVGGSGVSLADYSGPGNGPVCGYSYPYNGQGCDTNAALATASSRAGASVAQMAGCYTASSFTVAGDDCTADPSTWSPVDFDRDDQTSGCKGGARYVKYSSEYGLWIGAELCSADSYKLYLSDRRDGRYAPIADGGGHGQDHCELVNPTFTLPNDDEITSGTCKNCSVTPYDPWSWPGAVPVYVRYKVGDPFTRETWLRWEDPGGEPISPHHTSSQYSCGVRIPGG